MTAHNGASAQTDSLQRLTQEATAEGVTDSRPEPISDCPVSRGGTVGGASSQLRIKTTDGR